MSGSPMSRMTASRPVTAWANSRPVSTVGRMLHDVAVLLQEARQGAGESFVVLDQEQVHRVRPSAGGLRG